LTYMDKVSRSHPPTPSAEKEFEKALKDETPGSMPDKATQNLMDELDKLRRENATLWKNWDALAKDASVEREQLRVAKAALMEMIEFEKMVMGLSSEIPDFRRIKASETIELIGRLEMNKWKL